MSLISHLKDPGLPSAKAGESSKRFSSKDLNPALMSRGNSERSPPTMTSNNLASVRCQALNELGNETSHRPDK